MVYADYEYYYTNGGDVLREDNAEKALAQASASIDALTYNRIVAIGFDRLTDFQKTAVKTVCCDLADFQTENADIMNSPISGYNINGVSVNFANSATITTQNGIMIPSALLARLRGTGLMWGAV